MSTQIIATPEDLKKQLLYLYQCQTLEERDCSQTIEYNGKGFNGVDAEFLSSLAQWILGGKHLTDKQLLSLQLRIPKYSRQFADGSWQHIQPPSEIPYTSNRTKTDKNRLDIDPRTKGLIFYPSVYPSQQIKTLAPFFWQDHAWHQAKPNVTKDLVGRICQMFGEVEVDPSVSAIVDPKPVVLPEIVSQHPTLFPFQKETIQFALTAKHGLIGLAPGLGKSACAIFAAQSADRKRILVVAPLSLIYNWRNEIKKWVGEETSIVYKKNLPVPAKWTVTNYDTVRLHPDLFSGVAWDCIIVDESILIKNRKAKRTETIKDLLGKVKPEYVWLLSGAPVSRLYDDMWAQLNILAPHRFTSYWRFTERYCYVEQDQWGWHILSNRPRAAEDIKKDLSDVYFCRTQDQVLDLPEWIFDDVHVRMGKDQDRVYGEMEDAFVAELGEGNALLAPNVLSQLTRLVQLASNPLLVGGKDDSAKWDAVKEMLEYEKLPAIIWTSFIRTAEIFSEALKQKGYRVGVLNGSTSSEERQKTVDAFQAGELDVIIAHPAVGKFGFTLTAARTSIYMERGYNGDDYYQSLHRVRRIGTQYSPHIIHLLADRENGAGTVDQVISKILQTRRENVMALTTGELKSLFAEGK